MRDNKYLAWASFALFALSAIITFLFFFLAALGIDFIENPGAIVLLVGAFSLVAAITGFLSFKLPQAKAGAVGGLVLFLMVLLITPVGRSTTVLPPQTDAVVQEQTSRTGIAEIDAVIETVLSGARQEQLELLQFSSLPCTQAEGLGGPPKCAGGEEEGTVVEVFPILGSEGHHMRRGEIDSWEGLPASDVFAVYRVSDQVYSDASYPAGEYGIVFILEEGEPAVNAHVRDGRIIRLDYLFVDPSEIDLEQLASEIILAPQR